MLRKLPAKPKPKTNRTPQSQVESDRQTLDLEFIAAFREGRIAPALRALDAGANPSHAAVHAEMLQAGADVGKGAYRAMWQLYFEMRGPFGDADEIVELSRAVSSLRRGQAGAAGLAPIARKAIVANTPKHLLREVGGPLLADAVAAADPQSVRLLLDRGADAGFVDAQGSNLLQLAATAAHPEVLQQLVAAGLDPQRSRMRDGKPLLMAVAATVTRAADAGTDAAAVQRYLAQRKDDQARAADALRALLAIGLKADAQWRSPSGEASNIAGATLSRSQPVTALQAAMRAHNPLAVEVLLDAGAQNGAGAGGAHQKAFAAAFAQHVTTAFDDATVDALSIIRLLRLPRKRLAATAQPSLTAAVAALATRRWNVDTLAPVAPARRPALMSRLNRALLLAPESVASAAALLASRSGRSHAAADLASAFMAAVQARLPGAVGQLAAAGALPALAAHPAPKGLLRCAQAREGAAAAQLKAALDARADDAAPLGQAWNALIAQALVAAANDADGASESAIGKLLWSKAALLRHAHLCESGAIDRLVERGERAQLLRLLTRRLAGLAWPAQWQLGLALLEAPSAAAMLADDALPPAKKTGAKKAA